MKKTNRLGMAPFDASDYPDSEDRRTACPMVTRP